MNSQDTLTRNDTILQLNSTISDLLQTSQPKNLNQTPNYTENAHLDQKKDWTMETKSGKMEVKEPEPEYNPLSKVYQNNMCGSGYPTDRVKTIRPRQFLRH